MDRSLTTFQWDRIALSLSNDVVVSLLATSYQALSSPRMGMDDSMFLLEKNCFEFNVHGTVRR
jgi:hypothetical protein